MRIKIAAAVAGALLCGACAGNVSSLSPGNLGGNVHTSGWSTDQGLPQGTSGATSVNEDVLQENCQGGSHTVSVEGNTEVVTGTACGISAGVY